ncbi:hypothetical protein D3273_22985 [Lichenibacterium minor]|uniref:Calcineurin-like phosphoesterase domain-containing protein n=1 Tax=Lichenibacterium minor TaxID=2316528 RepID=A0A4Q2U025_9HYPH|nr:metallophosphoesterase [Lichenibacterium minor]RYC29622.1 hypothetical protein D3273_22985 [Lichenibacterium minor]
MRLWTFSDLHLDARGNAPDPLPRAPASFDAVVVSGDLSSPLTAALDWLHVRLPSVPVVYVAGNHDAWCGPDAVDRYTLDVQMLRGRELAARHGITLLEDDDAVIGGVRFLGATLWSDLRLTARLTTMDPARVVGRGMLDYRRIRRRRSGRHHYVRPTDLLARHHASCTWLETELARPHDGPTVVVTHHAPQPRGLSRRSTAARSPSCRVGRPRRSVPGCRRSSMPQGRPAPTAAGAARSRRGSRLN